MSEISNDMSAVSGGISAPGQQTEQTQEQRQRSQIPVAAPEQEEDVDAAQVELSSSASSSHNVVAAPEGDIPQDLDSASALAQGLATQISGPESEAASAHSEITPAMALKLTQS
jgi:hypothetical protein